MDNEYTPQDLDRDIEALIKAGLVEVAGITEDGDWLYGLTDEAKKIMSEISTDPDKLVELIEIVEKVIEEQEE